MTDMYPPFYGRHKCARAILETLGWSDPTRSLGGCRPPTVGSLQPSPVFCPRPKLTVVQRTSLLLPTRSVHRRGERNGEPGGDLCLSRHVHPFSLVSARCDRCWPTK